MQEEVSLLQLCVLGHGINEDIYLIGENSSIGILERNLYATFSYSRKEPIEFIVIPIGCYSDKVKDQLTDLFSNIIKKKTKNFLWQSLFENPYNKIYDELINIFSGTSVKINSDFIEYRITRK
jgi:hypothetical protein